MRNHKSILVILLAAVLLLAASPACGQIIYGQPASGNLRVIYSHWNLEDDAASVDISQIMIPISGLIPMQDNLELRFSAANASTDVESGDDKYDLSGMSDIRLQLNQSLSDDRLLLSLGINLPTGKKKLSAVDERPVMSLLTENYLSFPIRRLGEGFGFNLLAGGATVKDNIRYGATIMYQINGAYEAYENEGDYQPGNLLSISASADSRSDELSILGEIIFSTFSNDKLEDRKVFKQSQQVDLHFGGKYDMKTYAVSADLRYLIRGRNTRYDAEEAVFDQLKVYGNEFFFAGRAAYYPNEDSYIAPSVDARLIEGNEFEFGSSENFGVGLEYGRNLGESLDAGIGFKYYTGSADDGRIDLSGYRLSASIQAAF
jgi:hypothetical protein